MEGQYQLQTTQILSASYRNKKGLVCVAIDINDGVHMSVFVHCTCLCWYCRVIKLLPALLNITLDCVVG